MKVSLWCVCRKIVVLTVAIGSIAWSSEIDAASLRLTWRDGSSNELGFSIERQVGGSFTQIATVTANATSYTDSGLTTNTMYCYRVRSFNSSGTSDPSNQACANATIPTVSLSVGGNTGSGSSGTTGGATLPSPGSGSGSTSTSQINGRWTDYRVMMKIRSSDNDAIGVMFRYVDDNNYYRFSWSVQEGYRRLEKIQNGVPTILARDSVPYVIGRTYGLEIIARDSLLNVLIDGAMIFSATDASFDAGAIALYSNYNQGSSFDDIMVQDLNTGAVLLSENFNDGTSIGWTSIDDGTEEGPALWSAKTGALVQSGNLGSYTPARRGAYALYTKRAWTDYQVTMKIRSSDNDSVGAMFRYVDDQNYYRFSWDREDGYRVLERIQNGVSTVLAKDSVLYVVGRTYQLQIVARGSTLMVLVDGARVFSVTDSSFAAGSIALYSNYNEGSSFDDILVQDLATNALLLSENFNDGNFIGWTTIDEVKDESPSNWSAKSGAFVQSSNVGSYSIPRRGTYALY